jgi:hypothetical protein
MTQEFSDSACQSIAILTTIIYSWAYLVVGMHISEVVQAINVESFIPRRSFFGLETLMSRP